MAMIILQRSAPRTGADELLTQTGPPNKSGGDDDDDDPGMWIE